MLDIVHGQTQYQSVAKALGDSLSGSEVSGTLYIGYPLLATADDKITVDAMLVSPDVSVVGFVFGEAPPAKDDEPQWEDLRERQDRLFVAIETNLRRHESLRDGRKLSVTLHVMTVFPSKPDAPDSDEYIFTDLEGLPEEFRKLQTISEDKFRLLQSAIQRVTTIKPRKRRERTTDPDSRGSILKKIEREIANLDSWQSRAAIESPEGPQRIRGLAGTGKTVVLALKAAYLHAEHPDWVIAVTFFTRSLYQQLRDLIRRFSYEHRGDEPNWDNLRIRHAWGGSRLEGLYSEIADHSGLTPRNYVYARTTFGREQAFEGVCAEALSYTSSSSHDPIYDAVLIDEAQDMPPSFFKLVHRFTHQPKRIIFAYDELQKISEADMPSMDDLFGANEKGEPNLRLNNETGQAQQDITLRVCYRNPPWALAVAHGLGFGIQKADSLVQHFDDPSMWTEIGYDLVSGSLMPGEQVTLQRSENSFPRYFKDLLDPQDVLVTKTFNDEREQAAWVADQILGNIQNDQLDHDDILVVLPNVRTAKSDSAVIMQALDRNGISSHLAGVTSSQDELFQSDSIALAHIFRAKGNESAMVYVVNSNECLSGPELITLRNTLFTAITRSKAWVRVCGIGESMVQLQKEIEGITQNNFQLQFNIPNAEELAEIRQIHRELTASERSRAQKAQRDLGAFIEALDRGDISIDNLPFDLRAAAARYFGASNLSDVNSKTDSD